MNLLKSSKYFFSKNNKNFYLEEGEYLSRNLRIFLNQNEEK